MDSRDYYLPCRDGYWSMEVTKKMNEYATKDKINEWCQYDCPYNKNKLIVYSSCSCPVILDQIRREEAKKNGEKNS